MARLGPGTWFDPTDGIPSPKIAARTVFLQEVSDLARPAVRALHDDLLPLFRVWNELAAPKSSSALVFSPEPVAGDARLDPAAPMWDWGLEGAFGSLVHVLIPGRDPEAFQLGAGLMDFIYRWCREWNLPPQPEAVVDRTSARHPERWMVEAIGYSLSKWTEARSPDSEELSLVPYPHGAQHLILPRPPGEEFRAWCPTREPWDVESGSQEPGTRIGYFHEARQALGLFHREARRMLSPYKRECEARLKRSGFQRVPQKRGGTSPERTSATHFRWFVRFQVLRERQVDIVEKSWEQGSGVDLRNVQDALRWVSDFLPLQRRSG